MSVDFDGLVNRVVTDPAIFGKAIIYTPQGGTPFTLNVVFDKAWATVDFAMSRRGVVSDISTTKPRFGCRVADFPHGIEPHQDDTCVIDGDTYSVADVQPDGASGWVAVTLN